jgi:hypothetical protein
VVSTWVNTIAESLPPGHPSERRLQVLRDPMYAKSTMNWAAIEL